MSRILNVLAVASVSFVASVAPIVPTVLIVATVVSVFSPAVAQVQPPVVEWEKTYGGTKVDEGRSVQQTLDGGYIVAGYTNSFGIGAWDVFLVKTDVDGNLEWQKTFGGAKADESYSVQQTLGGGYIVAGETWSFGAGDIDVFLVKTDVDGNLEWQKTFGGARGDGGRSVQQTQDNGYIVAGWTNSFSFGVGGYDVYLVKTDAGGNLVWEKTFGGGNVDGGYSVQQTVDGRYIVAGGTSSFGAGNSDVYLVKTDAGGNLVWEKTFGGTNDDVGYSVQETQDFGYIVAGRTLSFGAGFADVYLVKTDAGGNLVWEKTFGGVVLEFARSIQETQDFGYIMAGTTSESFGGSNPDVYLVKTNSQGNLEWQRTFGGVSVDEGLSVQQNRDSGYIVAGLTWSFGAGNGDIYLIKLKPDQPPPPKPCSQDAEVYDEMQTELSHNIEVFGLGRVCTADLTGTIGVKRYLPYVDPATGLRTIRTKITKLELTGTDPTCGEIKISLNPSLASGGKVVEQKAGTCFPADSYFDVFIQVQIPGQKLLVNCQPATMRCVVSTLPPIGCVYQIGTGFDVPLYDAASLDCASPGNPVGQIVAADHKPTSQPVPPVVIPPPVRTQLHWYNPQTNQWLPLTDQVRKDAFHATLPVVVIVHGWNIDLIAGLAGWNELAGAVATRLTNELGPQVNVLAWDWMDEARGGTRETRLDIRFREAAANVYDQSRRLARSLQRLFQADATTPFQQPIHLMGHSLGAGLVGMTGIWLQRPDFGGGTYAVANVTLFDPPDRVPFLDWPIVNSLDRNVPYLRLVHGTTVDCFSGTFNDFTYFSNVWYVVPGGGHDTFNWYREHVPADTEPTLHRRFNCDDTALPSTVGFGASATHAPAERQLRLGVCQTTERDVSLVAHSANNGCRARDEFVYAQYCLAETTAAVALITYRLDTGIGNRNCECTLPPDLDPESRPVRVRMRLRRPAGAGGGAGADPESLVATYTLPLAVSAEWDSISFTYRIESAPSPATLTLSIQDGAEVTPLFLATSNIDLGELADSGLLNITPYHGKEVSLIFSLTSDQPDAIVEVSNLTLWQGPFHANVAPVANAGVDQAVAVTDPLATVVQLDGSGTVDENDDALVYAWTLPDPANAGQEGIVVVGVQPTVELPLGGYEFTLYARDPFDGFSSDSVIVEVEHPFIRGDSNADGLVNIADAIATLNWLFNDTGKPLCLDAADTNDVEGVNLTDPIALLGFLFLGTEAPKPPFPGVGLDPTPELLLGCNLKQP